MRSIRARLEDLESRERASDPPPGEPSYKEQLRAKLDEQARREGPIRPEDKPDSEEVFRELRARLEELDGGGR